jgi:thiamine-phosphate pyrophosphorylase
LTDRPQIHLVTPTVDDPEAFRTTLARVVGLSRPASVHLRLATADALDAKRHVQALAAIVQNAGAALLVDPPVDFRDIARSGADGVHIADPSRLKAALGELKPDRIVGAGGLRNRDLAMTAGEEGADYVMFGEPRADGSLPPLEQVVERASWWVEVFNVPCVAYAPGPAAVTPLVATGAEFIAFGAWAFAEDGALDAGFAALG